MLLAGVVGCVPMPAHNPVRPVEEPKPETENGGDEEPESKIEATLKAAEKGVPLRSLVRGRSTHE